MTVMKKTYFAPTTEVVNCEVAELLTGSEVGSEDYGIGYGGIDSEGEHEPSSHFMEDLWP